MLDWYVFFALVGCAERASHDRLVHYKTCVLLLAPLGLVALRLLVVRDVRAEDAWLHHPLLARFLTDLALHRLKPLFVVHHVGCVAGLVHSLWMRNLDVYRLVLPQITTELTQPFLYLHVRYRTPWARRLLALSFVVFRLGVYAALVVQSGDHTRAGLDAHPWLRPYVRTVLCAMGTLNAAWLLRM
jgi:hypothetical protein